MGRCAEHDLLNCKCKEPLALFLVRQFRESSRERLDRKERWVSDDRLGAVGFGVSDGRILGGEDTRR